MSDDRSEFRRVFERHLGARRMTKAEGARTIGVSQPYITKVIRGDVTPTPEWLDIVGTALGLTESELVQLHRAAVKDRGYRLNLIKK